jgi:hypothetical protein
MYMYCVKSFRWGNFDEEKAFQIHNEDDLKLLPCPSRVSSPVPGGRPLRLVPCPLSRGARLALGACLGLFQGCFSRFIMIMMTIESRPFDDDTVVGRDTKFTVPSFGT